MTEPRSAGLQRRIELFRHRRASTAADRAAFETRRRHGMNARREVKLARLAERAASPEEPPTGDLDLAEPDEHVEEEITEETTETDTTDNEAT